MQSKKMTTHVPGVNIEFHVDPNIVAMVYRSQGFEAIVTSEIVDDKEENDEEVLEEYEAEPSLSISARPYYSEPLYVLCVYHHYYHSICVELLFHITSVIKQ